jgi:uncharacterized MAPEG superfamily protein
MSVEVIVLTWTVVLGFAHIVASSHAKRLQRGYRWTASARDEQVPPGWVKATTTKPNDTLW